MELKRCKRKMIGVLAGILLLAPASSWACTAFEATAPSVLMGELLEITESAPLHAAPGGTTMPGAFPHGLSEAAATRLAQATAVSTVLMACGETFEGWSKLGFHAQTRIPFGESGPEPGELRGVFRADLDNGGGVAGKISGTLSFLPNSPLAIADGTWSTLGKDKRAGRFYAVAYVPVPLGCTAATAWFLSDLSTDFPAIPMVGCIYLDPFGILTPSPGSGGPALVPLRPEEYSRQFGTGAAKFAFSFFGNE